MADGVVVRVVVVLADASQPPVDGIPRRACHGFFDQRVQTTVLLVELAGDRAGA